VEHARRSVLFSLAGMNASAAEQSLVICSGGFCPIRGYFQTANMKAVIAPGLGIAEVGLSIVDGHLGGGNCVLA